MAEISFPGEVDVLKATLVSCFGKEIDISGLIVDITLYEDIFSNTMSGYLLIEDSLDLITTLPLLGQEQFIVELQTPTIGGKIQKEFYIYKLQHKTNKKRVQMYMLNFCSLELISSSNSKVAKSFSGNISTTVSSIFTDPKYIGSKSDIFIENTKNDYSFIAPYWSPIETINWLGSKSLNKQGVANYLFFETNKSFEYTSIDTLLKGQIKREYVFSDIDSNTMIGYDGNIEEKYNVVETINSPVTFDYLRNINAGMFASKLQTFDITTKTINTTTFDYIDDFNKSTHLEKHPLRTDSLTRKKLASLYFIEKNNYLTGTYKNQRHSEIFLQRNSLLEQLSAFKLTVKVFGRTDIKVGNVVKFTINEFRQILEDEIEAEGISDYYTGKYLITAIRHQILNNVHTMYMEIVSDSFVKQIINR